MLDLKLALFNEIVSLTKISAYTLFLGLNNLDLLALSSFTIAHFQFARNLTFFFTFKFLIAIAFLILIRGGTPRYRYDYLTKLGWLKFLSFIILIFFLSLLFVFVQ